MGLFYNGLDKSTFTGLTGTIDKHNRRIGQGVEYILCYVSLDHG
jgi:hypothetical protein